MEPDLEVTTATRAATGAEFRPADRQFGWLVVNEFTYRSLRALAKFMFPRVDLSGVQVTEESAVARGMKIVRPDTITGDGALLLLHGGGYVLGTNRDLMPKAATMARMSGVPVFCPSYRLGPEDPFPAGLDDSLAAWDWLMEHAAGMGIDPAKVVIGGYSAGGGLAAALAQRIHDERGDQQPAGQLLVYPMLDDRTATRTELDKPRHRVWSNRNNRFGWTSYLGHPPGQSSAPYAVPARRDDVGGLPPAWIGVGTPDLFLDEDREYAQRLADAGVEVTYVEIDGGIHGFDSMAESPLVQAFDASAVGFVRRLTT